MKRNIEAPISSDRTVKLSVTDECFAEKGLPLCATLYRLDAVMPRACLLYFHGGGLLYGNRKDLPDFHIHTLLQEGYSILSFDYRLAPACKLPEIFADVTDGVLWYLSRRMDLFGQALPYVLWGRSAGAYLALMSGMFCLSDDSTIPEAPAGILSYYGYGFLQDNWHSCPSPYYLGFPSLDKAAMSSEVKALCVNGPLESRYGLYVDARQRGCWLSMFYEGKEKLFYLTYSFRGKNDYSAFPPVFLAHALMDPDVPFEESKALAELLPRVTTCFVPSSIHDFDRNTEELPARILLEDTLHFLEKIVLPF